MLCFYVGDEFVERSVPNKYTQFNYYDWYFSLYYYYCYNTTNL